MSIIDGAISSRKSKTGKPSDPTELGSIAKMARKSIDRHRAQRCSSEFASPSLRRNGLKFHFVFFLGLVKSAGELSDGALRFVAMFSCPAGVNADESVLANDKIEVAGGRCR